MVLGVLQPLLIGFAIAFVLNRPCRFFHRLYLRGLGSTRARKAARPLAVLSSYLALIAVITAILPMCCRNSRRASRPLCSI